MKKKEIDKLRNNINDLDDKIISLLDERSFIVNEIGKFKNKSEDVIDADRENSILDRLSKKIRGQINNYSLSLFLNVDFDILINRLKRSKNRPLLKDVNILTRLKQLDLERRKHFLNADIIIDNSQSSNKTFLKFKNIFSSLDD